jgi:predicted dienelactone hydrolase
MKLTHSSATLSKLASLLCCAVLFPQSSVFAATPAVAGPTTVTGASAAATLAIQPQGSYRAIDLNWTDAARSRDVPARLYWPDGASSTSKVPLVVFSHGLGGTRMGYSYLGRHWASLGFASLHVQHEGSDRAVWFGNVFTLFGRLQGAASEQNALARVKDISFAITQLLAEREFAPSIDASSIAVAGHSYGANTAMLIGGATVLREAGPLSLKDDRVSALILISAPPFTGEGDMAEILKPISIPTLHVTGTEDVIRVPGYGSDFRDRLAIYDAQREPRKMLAVFKGATHSIFTDRIDRAGLDLNEKVKRATKEISGLFLNTVLRDQPVALIDEWGRGETALLERKTPAAALKR